MVKGQKDHLQCQTDQSQMSSIGSPTPLRILIIILHKGISIEKSTYRGILNKSFGTSSARFCGAIL